MQEVGIPSEEVLGMAVTRSAERFGDVAFGEIERSLRARLRSHRLSQSFIDRCGEDALQKGIVEYLRAREAGTSIRDPGGFVVAAAFRRAIDELRREAREADGAAVEALLAAGRSAAPPAEDVAIEQMSVAELHDAIDGLPAEERQALSLRYFEELSNRRAAEILYCSERTFRRRLRSAIRHLSEAIGASVPEPGSRLALEVGVASWVSLRGARVLFAADPLAPLMAAWDSGSQALARTLDRLRELTARLFSGGAPERIGALASGPAGKVAGGCAGAAVVCALSGVVVSNVELGGRDEASTSTPPTRHAAVKRRQVPPIPHAVAREPSNRESGGAPPAPTASSPKPSHARRPARTASAAGATNDSADRREAEEAQVEEQMSGITRAAQEAEAEPPPSASGVAPVESAPGESAAPSKPPSPSAAGEERQAEKQFRGPLAP